MITLKIAQISKLVVSIFILFLCSQSVHAWWNEDWDYRKKLVLDTTANGVSIDSPLLNPKILVRLHLGNFVYFTDINAQGSDLRFIHSDDVTPLDYVIESIDTVAGIANIWVELPDLIHNQETIIYMYYGNANARSAENIDQFWESDDVAIYPFNERSGVPKDTTAFGHHAISADITLGVPGIIGAGIGLSDSDALLFGASEAIQFSSGFTISTWLKVSEKTESSLLMDTGELKVTIDNNFINLTYADVELRSLYPINLGQWHHVSIAHDTSKLYLFIDGQLNGEVATAINPNHQGMKIGATEENQIGFVGALDDLRVSTKFKGFDLIKFNALANREDTKLISYLEDESKASSGNNFGLIWTMLDTVRIEGWVIIGLLGILGLLSFDILVAKAFHLTRAENGDAKILEKIQQSEDIFANDISTDDKGLHSPLSSILSTYNSEIATLKENIKGNESSSAAIEVLRSSLDATLVSVSDQLNKKIVFVTMAITGGPFLGLLGTVMGVMITFATISAAGDVNVRTIAPGVAAALTTTVLGLAVAIPSLFGYNYIAGRISKRVTAMEVLSDKLLAKAAILFSKSNV